MQAKLLFGFVAALGFVGGACSDDGGGGQGLLDRGMCDALIECATNLAPEARDGYEATYGVGGSCWQSGANAWAACRDFCATTLDTLNQLGQATGDSCESCVADSDCAQLGGEAVCEAGLCVAGDSDGGTGDSTGDGDPTGDGDCSFEPSEECLRFVDCIDALSPSQTAAVEAEFGAQGSCWCGTQAEAESCHDECVQQLDTAVASAPTVSACHGLFCPLDALDPNVPQYRPITNGSCPDWQGGEQIPLVNPAGVAGSVCAPACAGVAQSCPEHPQTAAKGTCYLQMEGTAYCVARCWVDPNLVVGNQCQCGATCQPHGSPDAEGHHRGICTFE